MDRICSNLSTCLNHISGKSGKYRPRGQVKRVLQNPCRPNAHEPCNTFSNTYHTRSDIGNMVVVCRSAYSRNFHSSEQGGTTPPPNEVETVFIFAIGLSIKCMMNKGEYVLHMQQVRMDRQGIHDAVSISRGRSGHDLICPSENRNSAKRSLIFHGQTSPPCNIILSCSQYT